MAALSGEKTLAELSAEFGVHPTMISNWKQELVKRAGELFGRGSKAPAADDAQKVIDDLHRKIGQLQVECDFLAGQPAISRVRLPRFSGRFVSLQSTSWSWRPACRLRRLSVSGIPGPNATAPDYTNPRCS